jgi:hypothetical protein
MICIGVDYDTFNVHLVRVGEGVPTYHPINLAGDNAFDRLRQIPLLMPDAGFWQDVVAVGIEEPGGKYVVGKLKAVQGAIVACLPPQLLVAPYQAGLWRRLCGLKGNATKQEVQAWVYHRLDENPGWPQDAADAYCLAHAVAAQVQIREETT